VTVIKFILLALGLLILKTSSGQQLVFRGFPVDSISISSSSGYYHFDKKGTTTGTEDLYLIAFDRKSQNYSVVDYKRISILNTCEPDTATRKVKHLTKDRGRLLSNTLLDSLLTAFNLRFNKPTFSRIGYDKQQFLSLTDEKHVRNVAKAYKQDWNFRMKYSTKEENALIFEGCQNIDTFDLFLTTRFDTSGYIMVTDVWDEMHVRIKAGEKWFPFEGKNPNPFKQPWYDHSHTDSIPVSGIIDSVRYYYKLPSPIVNLNINKALSNILPHEFHRKNSITFSALTDQYIKWYLKRRDILSDYE